MATKTETLPAIVENAIAAQHIDLSQVNFLMPTKTFGRVLGEFDKIVIEVVEVDPNPMTGDVFEVSRGKLVPGKRPLMAISNALGILWYPKETRIVESTPRKSRARATGAMRKPNGEWITITEEKTVDLDAIEDEQRLSKEDEAKKGHLVWSNGQKNYGKWKSDSEKQNWIDYEVRKTLLSYRKFKDERAMTGAKERVIREFVALKNHYTAQELMKPLAFPRVIPDTSKMLQDPGIRQAAIDRMTGSVQSIFGPSPAAASRREVEASYEIQNGEEPEQIKELEEEVPFNITPSTSPEEEEINACLSELKKLSEIPYLHKDAKSLAEDMINQDKPNLDAVNALIEQIKGWLNNPQVIVKHGRYQGVTL